MSAPRIFYYRKIGDITDIYQCVACPFCELSSCDAKIFIKYSERYFWCAACDAKAFISVAYESTNELAEFTYPYSSFLGLEYVRYYCCEVAFICNITTPKLSKFSSNVTMDAEAVSKFADEIDKYERETKQNIWEVYKHYSCVIGDTLHKARVADHFVQQSKTAKKYGIIVSQTDDDANIHIEVQSHDLNSLKTPIPKHGIIYILLADDSQITIRYRNSYFVKDMPWY